MTSWLRSLPENILTDEMVLENFWKVIINDATLFISRPAVLFLF